MEAQRYHYQWITHVFTVGFVCMEHSLIELFKARDKEQSVKALRRFGEYLVDLLNPLSKVTDGMEAIHDILKERERGVREASGVLSDLDEQAKTLIQWAIFAQMFATGFENLESNEPPSPKKASEIIQRRMRDLLRSKGIEIDEQKN